MWLVISKIKGIITWYIKKNTLPVPKNSLHGKNIYVYSWVIHFGKQVCIIVSMFPIDHKDDFLNKYLSHSYASRMDKDTHIPVEYCDKNENNHYQNWNNDFASKEIPHQICPDIIDKAWWRLRNFMVRQVKFNLFLHPNEPPQRIFWYIVRQLEAKPSKIWHRNTR